jgi:hypothetical protein
MLKTKNFFTGAKGLIQVTIGPIPNSKRVKKVEYESVNGKGCTMGMVNGTQIAYKIEDWFLEFNPEIGPFEDSEKPEFVPELFKELYTK